MPSDATVHLSLPYIMPSQAQKHITHNEALLTLDGLVQLSVIDRDHTAPPEEPEEGDRYIVGDEASGGFIGRDGEVACFYAGSWLFFAPRDGWLAWVEDESRLLVHHAGVWQVMAGDGPELVPLLGVATAADPVNRLIVRSEAALFTHDGAGHQIKINKADAGDTASLLFQTGFSGRAEIGTVGDDDLVFKVSADGTSFLEAIRIAGSDGRVSVNSPVPDAQVFTSGGTWSKPAGLKALLALVVAGGGGGGGTVGNGVDSGAGGGGGAGGAAVSLIPAASLAATETVTVGSGGAGATGVGSSGSAGGTSSFGAHLSATGGSGGVSRGATGSLPSATGGAGGVGSNGNLWNSSGGGGLGWQSPVTDIMSGMGGASLVGCGGRGVNPSGGSVAHGIAGASAGSGGSGSAVRGATSSTGTGGAGAAGLVVLIEMF